MYKIEKECKASVIFEISISYNGYSYLIIYGKHINGYYCCLPRWGWCCKMAEPTNICYNTKSLTKTGIDKDVAEVIANAIFEKYAEPY